MAARLAAWGGARLTSIHGGRVALVERRVPLPPPVAERLAVNPATVYFDTETTGLSTGAGTVVILVAVGHLDGDAIVVRQALLPDYPDEPALLRTVMGWVEGFERMVTYNGRGFDIPLMAARMTIHGMGRDLVGLPARHDDLLPIARRLWRRILGGARLADVERGVLAIRRRSDCPSSEVPQRWFAYQSGASPDMLAAVIDHNAQDVASLALIDAELRRLREGGWRDGSLVDHRGLALELLRDGADDDALEVLEGVLAGGFERPSPTGEEPIRLRRLASRLLIARRARVAGRAHVARGGAERIGGGCAGLDRGRPHPRAPRCRPARGAGGDARRVSGLRPDARPGTRREHASDRAGPAAGRSPTTTTDELGCRRRAAGRPGAFHPRGRVAQTQTGRIWTCRSRLAIQDAIGQRCR